MLRFGQHQFVLHFLRAIFFTAVIIYVNR